MSEVIEIREASNGKQLEVPLHQRFRVILAEARTAGFRWYLVPSKETIFLPIEDAIEQVSAEPVGGTIMHHWDFQAETTGRRDVSFEYKRTWEIENAPTRTFSVTVHVI
jgi:predicted secreted protein